MRWFRCPTDLWRSRATGRRDALIVDCDDLHRELRPVIGRVGRGFVAGRDDTVPPDYAAGEGESLIAAPHCRLVCVRHCAAHGRREDAIIVSEKLLWRANDDPLPVQSGMHGERNHRCHFITPILFHRALQLLEKYDGLRAIWTCRGVDCGAVAGLVGMSQKSTRGHRQEKRELEYLAHGYCGFWSGSGAGAGSWSWCCSGLATAAKGAGILLPRWQVPQVTVFSAGVASGSFT
jgi:hypothetical protein